MLEDQDANVKAVINKVPVGMNELARRAQIAKEHPVDAALGGVDMLFQTGADAIKYYNTGVWQASGNTEMVNVSFSSFSERQKNVEEKIVSYVDNEDAFKFGQQVVEAWMILDGIKGAKSTVDIIKNSIKNPKPPSPDLQLAGSYSIVNTTDFESIINFGRAKIEPVNSNVKTSVKSKTLKKVDNATKAGVGKTPKTPKTNDYKGTFFSKHPELKDKVIVHHGVEQQVLRRPETKNLFTEAEIHSYDNLRGIPKDINSDVHLSKIRKEWNKFYKENPNPTKEQMLKKRQEIDDMFGDQFKPPVPKSEK